MGSLTAGRWYAPADFRAVDQRPFRDL